MIVLGIDPGYAITGYGLIEHQAGRLKLLAVSTAKRWPELPDVPPTPAASVIELRVNVEDPHAGFRPSPGTIQSLHVPGGPGVRVDSAIYQGYSIPPYYDSLIGKLIVHGRDRPEALARLNRALGELVIDGIETTIPLFHALLADPDIQSGDYNIHWLEKWLAKQFG